MLNSKTLRCQKCVKVIGYLAVTVKSVLQRRPDLDIVKAV